MQKDETDLRERAKDFALRFVRMFSALPKTTEAQVLGKQLLRSGTSIGANYREAYRARSKLEFIAKCGDSLRELEEAAYWLELLVNAEIVAPDKLQPIRSECDELIAIFVSILKTSLLTSSVILLPFVRRLYAMLRLLFSYLNKRMPQRQIARGDTQRAVSIPSLISACLQ